MTLKSEIRARRKLALDVINHLALTLVAIAFLFPFFWMVSNAVRSNAEVTAIPVHVLPEVFEWGNFAAAWSGLPFGRWRTLLRLQSALPLLASGEVVSRIAARVGYETPSAFVVAFRRETGTTPAAYFGRT